MSAIETKNHVQEKTILFSQSKKNGKLFSVKLDQQGFVRYTLYTGEAGGIRGELRFKSALKKQNSESAKRIQDIFRQHINAEIVRNDSGFELDVHLSDIHICSSSFNPQEEQATLELHNPILTHDVRLLNQKGSPYLKEMSPLYQEGFDDTHTSPLVDLHTHFGGAMDSQMIVDAINTSENPVMYPIRNLKQMGDEVYSGTAVDGEIDLTSDEVSDCINWKLFKHALLMDPLSAKTFCDMEDVYMLRGPLVKNLGLFPIFLEKLAHFYSGEGVEYVELSVSDIVKPEWMKKAIEVLPAIEQGTGVKIRFLVGLWRHSPPQYNDDIINVVNAYFEQGNPYIVGVDFMGHETNSTRDFEIHLQKCRKIVEKRPDFVVRVHAGESMHHPENIRVAIENGATRIGHALYGLNEEVIKLANELGIIFEIQLTSNVCLSSLFDPNTQIPIAEMLRNGLRVTIGTDGHGLYGTSNRTEERLLRRHGVKKELLEMVRQSNRDYIDMMDGCFKRRMSSPESLVIPELPKPLFDPSEWGRIDARNLKQYEKVKAALGEITNAYTENPVQVVEYENLNTVFADRTPIAIQGASSVSWEPIADEDKHLIREKLTEFFRHLDESKVVIVTGGVDLGLEELVHEIVSEFREQGKNFQLLGAISMQLEADVSEISRSLTHTTVIGESWYEKGPKILQWIKDKNGFAWFVGGGNVIKDEIGIARNIDLRFALMKGVFGASDYASTIYPDQSFAKEEGLIPALEKFSCGGLIKSRVATPEKVIDYFNKQEKKVVTFLGYSREYENEEEFIQQVTEVLNRYNPEETIINSGATAIGVGGVYSIAKKMGFQTTGIVSTQAIELKTPISGDVDTIFYIEDPLWGGINPETNELSPTSSAMVGCTLEAIALGGGEVASDESHGLRVKGVSVTTLEFNPKNIT